MGNTERTWIYWEGGRLVPVRTERPSGFGRWKEPRDGKKLVLALEGGAGDFYVAIKGPKFLPKLATEALQLHLGITPDNFDPTVWGRVPQSIKDYILERIRSGEKKVQNRLRKTSNEETLTGTLLSGLDVEHRERGWLVRIDSIEFSKQSKEPDTGADVAIVLDVLDDQGNRAFKSLWLQAKSATNLPADVLDLPRLRGQVKKMRAFTRAAYALVYTPAGVVAIDPHAPNKHQRLHEVLAEAMACKAGDPAAKLLGDSLNRGHVLFVLLEKARQ